MAYDEELAERVREQLAPMAEPVELKMFGGLAFMVNTHMACGIIGDELMVRVGKAGNDAALAAGAREMDFTGKTMAGFVIAGGPLIAADDDLRRWVTAGVNHAMSLPPKKPKPPKPKRRQPPR
jgi:TfoX/Sxy family transcriptional regulator of competence genes